MEIFKDELQASHAAPAYFKKKKLRWKAALIL